MIGYLGDIVFTAGNDRILTFSDLQVNRAGRFATHEIIGSKPVIEYLGPEASTISYNIILDSSLGVDVQAEIDRLNDAMVAGKPLPLVEGEKYHGDFVINALTETHSAMARDGKLIRAELALNMTEI